MITLSELVQTCNQLYPSCTDPSYNGLQVEGQLHISKIATAVSADLQTIQKAIKTDCQALIVHHGLFWERMVPCLVGPLGKRVRYLMESGVSLLAYHLPMDMHQEVGNNWKALQQLGGTNLTPFGHSNGVRIGVMGDIPKVSAEQFVKSLEAYYGNTARHAPGSSEEISRVGVISGGGHRWLEEAAVAGCDALITGIVDEPQWHQARELGIHLFALGHAATERVGPRALARWLPDQLQVEAVFLEDDNPF